MYIQNKIALIVIRLNKLLEMTGREFESYTLEEDFTREEFYAKFGKGSTFPQVVCDDKKLGGNGDTIKFLREQQVIKS